MEALIRVLTTTIALHCNYHFLDKWCVSKLQKESMNKCGSVIHTTLDDG